MAVFLIASAGLFFWALIRNGLGFKETARQHFWAMPTKLDRPTQIARAAIGLSTLTWWLYLVHDCRSAITG